MLLAPFLGLRGANGEPELLGALGDAALPEVFLGYGRQDRYARASELLAQRLPAARVSIAEGGHDWPTWIELWHLMLAQAFAKLPRKAPSPRATTGRAHGGRRRSPAY